MEALAIGLTLILLGIGIDIFRGFSKPSKSNDDDEETWI